MDSDLCIDNDGWHGDSTLNVFTCHGIDDQKFKLTENGNIINLDRNQCVDYTAGNDVRMTPCDPEVPTQYWDIYEIGEPVVKGHTTQIPFVMQSRGTENCLYVINRHTLVSGLTVGPCSNADSSIAGHENYWWYMHNRGDIIAQGYVVN